MNLTHLTPKLICEQTGVGIDTVLSWIHSKKLKAANVSNAKSRPRWLIAKTDFESFLEERSNQEPSNPKRRRSKVNRKNQKTYV